LSILSRKVLHSVAASGTSNPHLGGEIFTIEIIKIFSVPDATYNYIAKMNHEHHNSVNKRAYE
jgi:hypothetical protein